MAHFWLLCPDKWGKLAKKGLSMSPLIDLFDFLPFPWISMVKLKKFGQKVTFLGFADFMSSRNICRKNATCQLRSGPPLSTF